MVLTQGSYKPKTKIGQQYLLAKKIKKKKKRDSILKIIKKTKKKHWKYAKMHTDAVITSIALKEKKVEVSSFIHYGVMSIYIRSFIKINITS